MDTHEDSPGRLRTVLSRNRKAREDSLVSPVPDLADRASLNGDAAEQRLSRISTVDTGVSDSSQPKIAKLMPGHSKRKEKRRKAQQAADDEADRGRNSSVDKVATAADLSASTSLSTLDSQPEGDIGSLMTSESEEDIDAALARSSASAPPPLRTRESHHEYLTSSSPHVKATTVVDRAASSSPSGVSPSRAATLPAPMQSTAASRSQAESPINGSSKHSVGSADSASSDKSRGTSPGQRLKGALKGSKKVSEPELPRSNPISAPEKIEGFAARRASKGIEPLPPLANVQSFHSTHSSGHQSNKSLPSIITTPGTPPPLPTTNFERTAYSPIPASPADGFDIDSSAKLDDSSLQDSREGSPNPVQAVAAAHRRARSDSQPHAPSKLSQSMNPPITPLIEESRTPGTRNISISSSGGFFTSMFSAAQNAATTLTTTLGNNPRARSATTSTQPTGSERSRDPSPAPEVEPKAEMVAVSTLEAAKSLAIDTIGSGELSLSHLGISNDDAAASGSPGTPTRDSTHNRSRSGTVVHRENNAAKEEDISAARAVSAAYEEKPLEAETPLVEDVAPLKSTGSAYGGSNGEHTPSGSVVDGDPGMLLRSSSLKNKLERTRRRRREGSQSTLGVGGGAMLASAGTHAPRLTGFAVASKKRNKDFHTLFKTVPDEDYLIEDYSCALQRDIILAGRIYISEGHVCFSSNILGWVTTLVISFDEVVAVEKESTAMVFPNAIAIQTLHARHLFRSLLSREATYDLLIGIWKINHPGLQSSETGTRIVNGADSKPDKSPGSSDDDSEASDEDGMDDEDGSGSEGEGSGVLSGEGSLLASEGAASPPKSAIPKRVSTVGTVAGLAAASGPAISDAKAGAQASSAAAASTDFPGPVTHGTSQCADSATHYATLLKDDVIAAPLGKIYTMVFGPASGGFMSRWLVDDQKSMELQFEDDKKGLSEEGKSRTYSYIKPLGGAIGPKQTKCITTETLDALDLEKAVSVTVSTQTPDVPSGNVFSVKTRYCLMWAPNNSTRMVATCTIEWTGKSWLKSPIEKGANDGQVQYVNDLLKTLRAAVSKGKPAATSGANGKGKKSKKKSSGAEQSSTSLPASKPKAPDWGLFEPVRAVLGPVASILDPLLNAYALVVVLSVLLMYSWLRTPSASSRSAVHSLARTPTSQRIAAYEELWRAEEAALWTWLEERIGGAEGMAVPVGPGHSGADHSNADRRGAAQRERQQVLRGEGALGSMGEKEVRRAVEITEEKLRALKDAVGRMQGESKGDL